jgi:hypothetical protein
MPKLHDVEQGTEAWERLRLGIPTSSSFDKIITPEGKPSKQQEKYAYFLLAERFLNRKINTYTSAAMENGKIIEEDAAADYELQSGLDTSLAGFVTTDDGLVGCSPDRLVGDEGLLEIKCPQPQTQMEYLITGKVAKEYYPQLQGQLYVTGRKWVDILSFNPELPRSIIRVERDDAYIGCLENLLWEFNNFLKTVTDKISEMQPLRKGIANDKPEIRF